ncbi:AMIN-like domain-containing (lipo)protein [Blastococcus brunescens]|uniref:AMIN-like domain-containing protein n=1 Tax=Blastococcus brunescens TaxID=1564165 RepID=A0ABZ1B1S1_9ACTN|nr:hypothetical protein [Blastococcus sp. BMG 8361]WRL63289.1 hypothetical protein U6N30_26575 [Blastococcus sp. BMG 8361]
MSIPSRPVAAVLSLLLAGPILLAGCAEQGTSEAGSTSAATGTSTEDVASETTAPSEPEDDGADAPEFPAGTEGDAQAASADASVTVSDIRIGAHDGFDRVVLEVGGTGVPGWDVRYVDAASSQGSGNPVDVAGTAVLQVTLTGAGYPYDTGVEEYEGGPLTSADTTVIGEVVWDATYEGTSVAFIGTTGEHPFRVHALEGPKRVVIDVAHTAG